MRVVIHERLGDKGPTTHDGPILVVSHGCIIDKPHSHVLHVCRLMRVDQLSPTDVGNIRGGGVKYAMYLDDVPVLGEMYVDFRHWHRVLREDLRAAQNDGRRVASMSPDGRLDLQAQLYRFHTRRLIGEAPPPDPEDW